jgi:hypothetical protein
VLEDRLAPATFTVRNTNDSGADSLRQAIIDANTASGPDRIAFDGTVFNTPQTITLTSGELGISDDLTVQGPGANLLTVSGNNASRVFQVAPGVTVELKDAKLVSGRATQGGAIYSSGDLELDNVTLDSSSAIGTPGSRSVTGGPGLGGGIYVASGNVALSNSTLSNLVAQGGAARLFPDQSAGANGQGGAIYVASGSVSLSNSTLLNVSARGSAGTGTSGGGLRGGDGQGGAIYLGDGSVTLTNTTLANASAQGGEGGAGSAASGGGGGTGQGGGIFIASGTVTLTNATLSGDSAQGGDGGTANRGGNGGLGQGGGIFVAGGSAVLTNATLSGNSAQGGDGAIGRTTNGAPGGFSSGGLFNASTVTLINTIVAGNQAGGSATAADADVAGSVESQGNNLVGIADGSTGWVGADLTGTAATPLDAKLATLADNGGPTETMALLLGSKAINAGTTGAGVPAKDQRDQPRVGGVDIGAFECQGFVSAVSGSGQSAKVTTGFTNPLVVLVTDPLGTPKSGVGVTFTAPGSGASAALSGLPATTAADGKASVTATATTVAGSYFVSASLPFIPAARFALTNTPGDPASVAVVAGSGQSAAVATAFKDALVVVVKDAYGNPVPDVSVTFTAPPSGASATLAGSPATTGADGRASVTAKANATVGTYTVTAAAAGVANPASFTLTNVHAPPTVAVPAAQTAYEDVDLTFTGVNRITVGDPEGDRLTVTLAVGHGTLTVGTTTGLTVTGNGSRAVTLSGSIDLLNAALATLVYRGVLNFGGDDALTVTADDGRLSTSKSVAIHVKSAAEQAADLQARVAALQAAGVLNKGQANSLTVKLNLKGNNGDIGKVQAFLDEVQADLKAGLLTQSQADALLGPGNTLLLSVTRR